jgi:hypothetical protein
MKFNPYTPWFPTLSTRPVRRGWYEVRRCVGLAKAFWNGRNWECSAGVIKPGEATCWRGLKKNYRFA